MSRRNVRGWKLVLPLAALALGATLSATSAMGAASSVVRVAVMTDCKGAFGGAYEAGAGGANIALAQFAGGKPKNTKKPSAGITGAKAGGKTIQVVGYGCGDDTPATVLKETRRLMQQQKADVMVGPLSGDEAVAVANWAKARPAKTVIIGTAGSQDPTLQIAPKNVFRYHGDGAQWNAGLGEILYKKSGWRRAAIIMDDYSFGWTSAAGIIADFCAIGGQITKRVFPPLNTTDYSSWVRQLPPPSEVDGYFWVVGGTGTGPALRAFEQAYGTIKPEQHSGNLFLWFLTGFQDVAPRLVGSYVGGFGTAPGLKSRAVNQYHAAAKKVYPSFTDAALDDGFLYNYYQATKALVTGLNASAGAVGGKLQQALPKTLSAPFNISNRGNVTLDANRQAVQDQWPVQIVEGADGNPTVTLAGYVPNVGQSFGGLFKKSSPPPGRTQPPCVKKAVPWQGKIREVRNGVVTTSVIK
jgi:branched-chain amino acid transport system substrate-binding protein